MAYELIKNLDREKYEPVVLCYGKRKKTVLEKEIEKLCTVIYGEVRGRIGLIAMMKIMRMISELEPDIIHAHMGGTTFAVPWALLHRRQSVVTVHTKPEQAFSKKNEKLIRHSLKKGCVTLVAVSEDNCAKVKKYFNVYDSHVQFVNNGIDIGRFQKKEHDGFAFINVARQDENKNQRAILRTFGKIVNSQDNLKLYLIGNGPEHEGLVKMVSDMKLQDRVIIPGSSNEPEIYYAVSDVYIQSSHREAMPLSVLEAMAAGLPVISTDVGGLRDIVKSNGILVRDNSDQELEEAMRRILNEEQEELTRRGQISKEIVQKYSSQGMAEKYMEIYDNCLRHEV